MEDLGSAGDILRGRQHRRLDLGSGSPGQHQGLDVRHDLRPQGLEGNVLVIAAGNQNHLLGKAPQARRGAGGRGGDGVVVEPDSVLDPDQLDPVLHAPEGPGHRPDVLVGDPVPHRQDGGHVVFDVM